MYLLPVLLALFICALVGMGIVLLDAIEEHIINKGRLDKEQRERIISQELKLQAAQAYVSYLFKR